MTIQRGVRQTQGLPQLLGKLKSVEVGAKKAVEMGLLRAGLHLQAKSQEVVPVDTGALRASAFTRLVTREGGGQFAPRGFNADVQVGYTMPYAIYVHEDLTMSHKPGKIAKYLERPAMEEAAAMRQIVSAEVKRGISQGARSTKTESPAKSQAGTMRKALDALSRAFGRGRN